MGGAPPPPLGCAPQGRKKGPFFEPFSAPARGPFLARGSLPTGGWGGERSTTKTQDRGKPGGDQDGHPEETRQGRPLGSPASELRRRPAPRRSDQRPPVVQGGTPIGQPERQVVSGGPRTAAAPPPSEDLRGTGRPNAVSVKAGRRSPPSDMLTRTAVDRRVSPTNVSIDERSSALTRIDADRLLAIHYRSRQHTPPLVAPPRRRRSALRCCRRPGPPTSSAQQADRSSETQPRGVGGCLLYTSPSPRDS